MKALPFPRSKATFEGYNPAAISLTLPPNTKARARSCSIRPPDARRVPFAALGAVLSAALDMARYCGRAPERRAAPAAPPLRRCQPPATHSRTQPTQAATRSQCVAPPPPPPSRRKPGGAAARPNAMRDLLRGGHASERPTTCLLRPTLLCCPPRLLPPRPPSPDRRSGRRGAR